MIVSLGDKEIPRTVNGNTGWTVEARVTIRAIGVIGNARESSNSSHRPIVPNEGHFANRVIQEIRDIQVPGWIRHHPDRKTETGAVADTVVGPGQARFSR
jgi:hypothetical protein